MRKTGTLQTWNDDRGFGFISPLEGDAQIFVHISAFVAPESRPTIGEKVTYIEGTGRDGRPQAIKVARTAFADSRTPKTKASARTRSGNWLVPLVAVVVVAIASTAGYQWYKRYTHRLDLEALPATTAIQPLPGSSPIRGYVCDGRTRCSQMTSCAEATWFINHCPGTKMDGNHDGVPCEEQWCGKSLR